METTSSIFDYWPAFMWLLFLFAMGRLSKKGKEEKEAHKKQPFPPSFSEEELEEEDVEEEFFEEKRQPLPIMSLPFVEEEPTKEEKKVVYHPKKQEKEQIKKKSKLKALIVHYEILSPPVGFRDNSFWK